MDLVALVEFSEALSLSVKTGGSESAGVERNKRKRRLRQ